MKVVGVGNPWRRDDAAGLVAVRHLRGRLPDGVELLEREGEPSGLIDAWKGAEMLWLVDAVSSGAPPGTLRHIDVSDHELPAGLFRASTTHHLGVGEAIELARALGRLPRRVMFVGIEGASFEPGDSLTPEVEAAAKAAADAVLQEVEACTKKR